MNEQKNEQKQGRHEDFYFTKHGFIKDDWHEHAPSPEGFQPAYLSSPEFQKNGYHC